MNTTHKTMQQKAAEAHNACRLKGDSMLDNNDCSIAFNAVCDSEAQACAAFLLIIQITFCCQAEVVLFQMAVR